jgi:hypothetical protein
MSEMPERLAESIARRIERRRFIRRSAAAVFSTVVGVAAGGGLEVLTATKALANPCGKSSNKPGPGCPVGGANSIYGYAPCGPSPCCSWYGSSNCNCEAADAGNCKSKGANNGYCEGDGRYYSATNCWSCSVGLNGYIYTTTCCDCGINSAHKSVCQPPSGSSGGGYYANRCVSWYLTSKKA